MHQRSGGFVLLFINSSQCSFSLPWYKFRKKFGNMSRVEVEKSDKTCGNQPSDASLTVVE